MKEEVAKAKKFLTGLKDEYYKEVKLSSKLSKVKIKIEANMRTKRENFCFAPLCNKAERIAIPKSSLLVAIACLTIN